MRRAVISGVIAGIVLLTASCCRRAAGPEGFDSSLNEVREGIRIIIHLEGVRSSDITLIPMGGPGAGRPLYLSDSVIPGKADTMYLSRFNLPGEFRLQFSYRPLSSDTTLTSGKYLIASGQDIELWINPRYSEFTDSTRFASGENENRMYTLFSGENNVRRKPIAELWDYLGKNADKSSALDRKRIKLYERSRVAYNKWIDRKAAEYKGLFLGEVIKFEKMPPFVPGSYSVRKRQVILEDFTGALDISDSLVIRTAGIREWMSDFMHLFAVADGGSPDDNNTLIKSGLYLTQRARQGHPLVYGWVTDYYMKLYTSRGMIEGIQMLQPHLSDPHCVTPIKSSFLDRINRQDSIRPGVEAPDFTFFDRNGDCFRFSSFRSHARYKLLLFINSGCWKCKTISDAVFTWQKDPVHADLLEIFAVNMDETLNYDLWETRIAETPGWHHMMDEGNSDSEVANEYSVIGTPVMILVDALTGRIIALPASPGDLTKAIEPVEKR